jgi:riboflavin synthase
MFTGIIETLGKVAAIEANGVCTDFIIESPISNELKIDQSLSHDGACLTIVETENGKHRVTAVPETLQKTNLGEWQPGSIVNLERCTIVGGRLDGHIVSGHVDQTANCVAIIENDNSWVFTFQYTPSQNALIVEKGSICINGISLTVFNVANDLFSVAIIPYTFEYTNIHKLSIGSKVNLEFDLIGKYVAKIAGLKNAN